MAGTSLAEQLKRLAAPQTSILVHTKKRESLLFDPKDAADIDRATFYEIGLEGLEELKGIDPRLGEFERTLFNEASQQLERAVEDKVANEELDALLHRFLSLLSPYVNLKAAQKALEWLIQRYHIHQYNTDALVALFLPYHDTNIFARMVQILPLKDKGGRWIWLEPLRKEGIPMSKLFLLSRASTDPSFFKFICNLPLQAVQVHGEKSYCLTTLFAFYCTTVIGALDQSPQVSEVQVTYLLPSLIAGLSSSHLDFIASAYMILGHLVTKIRLTPTIFNQLFYKVAKSDQPTLRTEAALVLVVMAQCGQPSSVLPTILHLASGDWFLPALAHLAASGVVVYPLVSAFVSESLASLTKPDNPHEQLVQEFVTKMLQELSFNGNEAESLFRLFADKPLSGCKWFQDTLHQLEKSYPEAFDRAVKTHSSLVSLVPGLSEKNELFQKLNHPVAKVRLEAVQYIKGHKELLQEEWVRESLTARLSDDSSKVVKAALELASCLPQEQLLHQLINVASHSWHHNKYLGPIALDRLLNLGAEPSLIIILTLPFLLPSSKKESAALNEDESALPDGKEATSIEKELAIAKELLNCPVMKKLPILKPLWKKLVKEGENVTSEDFSREVYGLLQSSMESLDLESVLKSGKQLESQGTVYQLITVLVAAAVLPEQASADKVKVLLQTLKDYNSSKMRTKKRPLDESNLAEIVAMCRGKKLPYQGSLYALTKILEKVKPPKLDESNIYGTQDASYVILVDIFCFAVEMTESKNKRIAEAYSEFCDIMIERQEDQIDELSRIALARPLVAKECMRRLSCLVDEATSLREQVLVPAMLVSLRSADEQERHYALAVLLSLTRKLALPSYHKLLHQVAGHREEIAIDREQVNVALYLCLSPEPSVQSLLAKSDRRELATALDALINIVVSPNTPAHVAASLLDTLDQVNSQELLMRLIPVAMGVLHSGDRSADQVRILKAVIRRVNVTSAAAFDHDITWSFVETCLSDHKPLAHDGEITAVLMLQQITRELFASLTAEQQQRLVSLVVHRVTETEVSDVTSAAASSFKKIVLDANIAANLLERMRDVTVESPSDSTKKRGWAVKRPPPLELLTTSEWKQGLSLLEFIQNKKKLDNVQVLLPRLFEILNRCLQFEEQSPVEYTKQVLLTTLLHCCAKLSPDGGPVALPETSLQVESVVECVRLSSNPQTHHHALLLLAHMASMIPERVLHSIMPIFTFMGSSVLRQDDAYSFQIISKIVETIVPVLMMAEAPRDRPTDSADDAQLTPEVVGVLRVFAGALLDVPEHRRVPLYTKLLVTLGQDRVLWGFLAVAFECHVMHPDSAAGKEPGSIPKRLEACLQLCHQFSPATVLSAACRLMDYLCQLPTQKGDKRAQAFKKSSVGVLFDVERATDKQLRHYTYTGLTFLSLLLSSKHFLRLVSTLTLEEIQNLEGIFQQLFEGILTFTQCVSKQVDSSANQPSAKYWKSMFNICFDVLTKTNALLPGDMFLSVVQGLVTHELVTLRVKALELLNWRLQQAQPMDPARLLALLPCLLALAKAKDTEAGDRDTEQAVMQQTALLSVKFLARQLAAQHPDDFQPVFKVAVKLVKRRRMGDPVLASAVLCAGELCHTMGAHAIAHLPSLMPPLLNVMGSDTVVSSGDLVLLSVVSAVHKIVDSLACFLSPYLPQLLQQLCTLSAECARHGDNTKVQPVLVKIKSIRQKISSEVPLRALLPAVSESYAQLTGSGHVDAVAPLLSLLAESFKSGNDLTPEVSTFFLTALDFRSQASPDDVSMVEPAVIKAIIALVFKLSESAFRPFYYKIFNWAFQNEGRKERSITFYKLTCSMAESLKGLFVSFAQYFLKNAATLLDEHNAAKQTTQWEGAEELVDAILRALHTVLLHDATHFVNKERFDTVMQPVVDQLENQLGGEEKMQQRSDQLVIPCLTQMAVSAADDTLWKNLNYQILLKTRHNSSLVRIGGVMAVCEIAKKLGEEFLPLLPETVPFLAELLEDEDENVEKTCRRVVQELESALGEPISKYF